MNKIIIITNLKLNQMNAENLAKKLNGINRRNGFDKEITEIAKQNRLVIAFGESDDILGFDGAVYDEVGAYDGGSAFFTESGLLENKCDDENCPYFEAEKGKAREVKAVWDTKTKDGTEVSWVIKTEIPHFTFEITGDEDEGLFCEAIVFCLDELKA